MRKLLNEAFDQQRSENIKAHIKQKAPSVTIHESKNDKYVTYVITGPDHSKSPIEKLNRWFTKIKSPGMNVVKSANKLIVQVPLEMFESR